MANKDVRFTIRSGLEEYVDSTIALPNELHITTDTHRLFTGDETGKLTPVVVESDDSNAVRSVDDILPDSNTGNVEYTIETTKDELENFNDGNGKYPELANKIAYVSDIFSGIVIRLFELSIYDWTPSVEFHNYNWEADISIPGLKPSDFTQIFLNANNAIIGNGAMILSGTTELNDAIRIYARLKPSDTLNGRILIMEGEDV